MQSYRKETVIVGLVVFIAFVVALWAIFYLQGYISRKNKAFYQAQYEHVGLLKLGDNVTLAGVPIGRVESIGLAGKKALVHFFVDSEVKVAEGTVAVIEASDLFGNSFLTLQMGDGPPLPSGSELKGVLAPGIRDLIKSGVVVVQRSIVVLEETRSFLARLDSLVGPKSSLPRTFDNIEAITARARTLSERFESFGFLLEGTLASLDSAADGFREVVEDNKVEVTNTLERLNRLSARLDTVVADLNAGRGSLGRLLRDERLYEDLRQTAVEAQNLIREIRDHPEKFINVKVF